MQLSSAKVPRPIRIIHDAPREERCRSLCKCEESYNKKTWPCRPRKWRYANLKLQAKTSERSYPSKITYKLRPEVKHPINGK